MYGRIHRGITFKSRKLCKILPVVLQMERANTIISRPFLKNGDGYLSLASYYRNVLMAFRCMLSCAPEYLSSQFIKRAEVSNRRTRNSQTRLNIPLFKTASGQRTFYYGAVSLWNSLDPSLKLCRNVKLFKQSFIGLTYCRNYMTANFPRL